MALPLIKIVFSAFCFLGGKWVAAFLLPFINPFFLISWSLLSSSVMSSGANLLNSKKGKKSLGRAVLTTFIPYFISAATVSFFVFDLVCKVGGI